MRTEIFFLSKIQFRISLSLERCIEKPDYPYGKFLRKQLTTKSCSKSSPSQMFDWVINTPLLALYDQKRFSLKKN